MSKNGQEKGSDEAARRGGAGSDGKSSGGGKHPQAVDPAAIYGQSFPFAKQFLQCPIPVGELVPREQWMVRIDGTFSGRRAKVLLSVKAASIANRYSEKRALDLLLDIFADAMGY